MKSYDEEMAPLFSRLLMQREFAQHAILHQINERLKTSSSALVLSAQEFSNFERAALALKDLWSARRRIQDKRYGTCVGCGEAIDLLRLHAAPTTEYCTACQDRHDDQAPATQTRQTSHA